MSKVRYAIRPARQSDNGGMYNVSRNAHRIEDYGELIPAKNHEAFLAYYRWSSSRRQAFAAKIETQLADPHALVLVAVVKGRVIGYAYATSGSEDTIVIRELFVRARYQGIGIGRALLEALYAAAPSGALLTLEVIAQNTKAIRLYMQQGFVVSQELKKHFFGAPLVRMTKHIY